MHVAVTHLSYSPPSALYRSQYLNYTQRAFALYTVYLTSADAAEISHKESRRKKKVARVRRGGTMGRDNAVLSRHTLCLTRHGLSQLRLPPFYLDMMCSCGKLTVITATIFNLKESEKQEAEGRVKEVNQIVRS